MNRAGINHMVVKGEHLPADSPPNVEPPHKPHWILGKSVKCPQCVHSSPPRMKVDSANWTIAKWNLY